MVTAVVESIVRTDVAWPVASLLVCLICIPALLWRRTHPLEALATTLVLFHVVSIAGFVVGIDGRVGLGTAAFVLILVYSLFRWGSGREAGIGLAIMVVVVLINLVIDFTGWDEAIGGAVILFFLAELGAIVRYQYSSRDRAAEAIRLREREQLARELHDIVAHHVSAIAVQAQAGIAVADLNPAAATEVLTTIEQEASRTLTELRFLVGALREGDEAELAPQHGVADIRDLAHHGLGNPHVTVHLHGNFDTLGPSLQSAIYRMAQESITNAVRHARNATSVEVNVVAGELVVELSVVDDGHGQPATSTVSGGYGLAGMAERAKLLGGTFEAGPAPGGGWRVSALLPSSGRAPTGARS